jgi:hypothetical protein
VQRLLLLLLLPPQLGIPLLDKALLVQHALQRWLPDWQAQCWAASASVREFRQRAGLLRGRPSS